MWTKWGELRRKIVFLFCCSCDSLSLSSSAICSACSMWWIGAGWCSQSGALSQTIRWNQSRHLMTNRLTSVPTYTPTKFVHSFNRDLSLGTILQMSLFSHCYLLFFLSCLWPLTCWMRRIILVFGGSQLILYKRLMSFTVHWVFSPEVLQVHGLPVQGTMGNMTTILG